MKYRFKCDFDLATKILVQNKCISEKCAQTILKLNENNLIGLSKIIDLNNIIIYEYKNCYEMICDFCNISDIDDIEDFIETSEIELSQEIKNKYYSEIEQDGNIVIDFNNVYCVIKL